MKQVMMLVFALLFFGLHTQAQEMDTRKEKKRIRTEQKEMNQLDLNDNQGQQLKEINGIYRDAHKQIMKNDALTQEQKREQAQALNKRRVEEIHTVVGHDKVQEFDRIHKNEKEKKEAKENKNKQDKDKTVKEKKEKKEKKGKKG